MSNIVYDSIGRPWYRCPDCGRKSPAWGRSDLSKATCRFCEMEQLKALLQARYVAELEWVADMKEQVISGKVKEIELNVIPIKTDYGYCEDYVVCDRDHPSGCYYEIIPDSEWKNHSCAKDIARHLTKFRVVHKLDEVLWELAKKEFSLRASLQSKQLKETLK